MGYFEKQVLPNEVFTFKTRKHWVLFLPPIIFSALLLLFFIYMQKIPALQFLLFAPWLLMALVWAKPLLNYYTSEFVVSNKRLLLKEGFFLRHVHEARLNSIVQISIEQTLLGQILGYGNVIVSSIGGAMDLFTDLDSPQRFQRAVHEALDKFTQEGS